MYENFVGTKIKQLDENLRNEYAVYIVDMFFSLILTMNGNQI